MEKNINSFPVLLYASPIVLVFPVFAVALLIYIFHLLSGSGRHLDLGSIWGWIIFGLPVLLFTSSCRLVAACKWVRFLPLIELNGKNIIYMKSIFIPLDAIERADSDNEIVRLVSDVLVLRIKKDKVSSVRRRVLIFFIIENRKNMLRLNVSLADERECANLIGRINEIV